MAIIKPSERYTTHKIGSSSDPTKPIGADDLVIVESVNDSAYPNADDRVRVAKQKDIIEDYFGTIHIYGRNKFNPALNTTLYDRYININNGAFASGLSGRILGYVPVVVGRTYILWLNPKEGKGTPPAWYSTAGLKFYAYNGSTYSMLGGGGAGGHNVNTWSGGEVPNVVALDSGRTLKIQIPTGCTHISCWISDPGETDNPQTSYYESMADFNSNVMLEEYEDYASAAKSTFVAYSAPVIKLLPDKIDMGDMVSTVVNDALADFEADTDNYGDLSITGDKIAEGTIPASKLSAGIQKGKVYAYNDGSHCYIRSAFNTQYDALIKLSMTHVTGIGYTAEYLIPKSNAEADFTTGLVTMKGSGDDDYPNNINQGYIGGNHGLAWVYKLTKTAHGFTYSDIGTVWLDERTPSPNEYAIVSILDENNIVVVGKDESVTDIWSLQQAITGDTLTESGGALRTFTGWTSTSVQFKKDATQVPHISTPIKKLLVNGNTEMQTGVGYYCDFIDLIFEYCILHPGRIRQYAVDNVGTFTTNITQAEADANIDRHSNQKQLFRCSNYGAMLVDYQIEFYMQTKIGYIGFVQASGIGDSDGSKIYAPRAAVDDTKSVDCRIRAYSKPFDSWEPTAAAMIDPNKWTDRVIQLKYNTSTGALEYGWVMGYIEDYALAKQAAREINTTSVWYISSGSTKKNYPRLISDKTVPAGTIIHAISYRQPVHPELWSAKATAVYFHEVAGYLYVYMDYHQSLIGSSSVVRDVVTLPSKYAGLTFTLHDKTDNIEVLIEDYIPSGGIALDIDCTSEVYGYCILKVKL